MRVWASTGWRWRWVHKGLYALICTYIHVHVPHIEGSGCLLTGWRWRWVHKGLYALICTYIHVHVPHIVPLRTCSYMPFRPHVPMCPHLLTPAPYAHIPHIPPKRGQMGPQKGPKMVHFRTPHSTISNVPFQLHHFGDPPQIWGPPQNDPF